jgi:tetratricopeptide (TPR) repeat protein
MHDYYEILQVSSRADPDVVQAAYRRLALKFHPDRNSDRLAHQHMSLLNEAFAVLSDPARRAAYDGQRQNVSAPSHSSAQASPPPVANKIGQVLRPALSPIPHLNMVLLICVFAIGIPSALYGIFSLLGWTLLTSTVGTLSACLFFAANWKQVASFWKSFWRENKKPAQGHDGNNGTLLVFVAFGVLVGSWWITGWVWGVTAGLVTLFFALIGALIHAFDNRLPGVSWPRSIFMQWRLFLVGLLAILSGLAFASRPASYYFERGIALDKAGNLSGALIAYDMAIHKDPGNPDPYVKRGLLYFNTKDYAQALADFTQGVRLDSKKVDALQGRAWIYLEKREFDLALVDLTEAIKQTPNNKWLYYDLGDAYLGKQDYALATDSYTAALRLDPKLALAYSRRGFAFSQQRAYDKAIADYTVRIGMGGATSMDFNNRGAAHEALRNLNAAVADYSEAIHLDPNNVLALTNRARIYQAQGMFQKAFADQEEANRLKAAPKQRE